MRAVTAATAAAILEIDRKSFDNLMLRLGDVALSPGRQGVERRIPVALVEELLLCRELMIAFGASAREAFDLARQVLGSAGSAGSRAALPPPELAGPDFFTLGEYLSLGIQRARLREEVQRRIAIAVETVVRRPRGRPRSRMRSPATPQPSDA